MTGSLAHWALEPDGSQLPPRPIVMLDEFLRCRTIPGAQLFRVPLDFATGPKRHVTQQGRFSQGAGVGKITRRWLIVFDSLEPVPVMLREIAIDRRRLNVVREVRFAQNHMVCVVREQSAFLANE